MLTAIPWSELSQTAQRIVRGGSAGEWLSQGAEGTRLIHVRCYPASNFKWVTVLAREEDIPYFLAQPGELSISSKEGEILLLNFRPRSAALLTGQMKGTVFPARRFDYPTSLDRAGSAPALIFGFVDSVELFVPSHAIDVIASRRQWPDPMAGFSFGFN